LPTVTVWKRAADCHLAYRIGPVADALLQLSRTSTPPPPADPGEPNLNPDPQRFADLLRWQGPTDRRHYPRRESLGGVSVRCPEDSPISLQKTEWLLRASRLKGKLLDIGMQGTAFLLPTTIAVGTTILLRLSNRRLDKTFDTFARVIRVVPEESGDWRIVCRFHHNLTFEQVYDLGRQIYSTSMV
jgi:hypothetical protein